LKKIQIKVTGVHPIANDGYFAPHSLAKQRDAGVHPYCFY